MDCSVLPLSHSNVQPPGVELAVSLVEVPSQMSIVPVMVTSGESFTVTTISSEAVQPRLSVLVRVIVSVCSGT